MTHRAMDANSVIPDLPVTECTSFSRNNGNRAVLLILLLCAIAFQAGAQTVDVFNTTANGNVTVLIPEPNGQILVGGGFTSLNGQARSLLGRVGIDGTLDTFNPGAAPPVTAQVECFGIQTDGKILIGGNFLMLAGQPRLGFGRVNDTGAIENAFVPIGSGSANAGVDAIAIQPDGKILIAGGFTANSLQRTNLARFNQDGTLDMSFTSSANSLVRTMLLQPDGKILLAGDFTNLAGQFCSHIGRLNTNGTLDTTFNSGTNNILPLCMAAQPDGKLILGGIFTSLQAHTRSNIARLNMDGSLDELFNPQISGGPFGDSPVYACTLQADGKIIVGGTFSKVGSQNRTNIARLNADGSVDLGFVVQARGIYVQSLALQEDGKILLGGTFTNLANQNITNLARINNTVPAVQDLSFDGTTINWLRGGSSPEAWRTTFEFSIDGTNWLALGEGIRVAGGWQLSGLSVSNSGTLRGRAFVAGGSQNGSKWFVESKLNYVAPPQLLILANSPDFGFTTNGFGFSIIGPTGFIVIQFSSNLTDWLPLSTTSLGTNPAYFNDPDSQLHSERYYRVRMR